MASSSQARISNSFMVSSAGRIDSQFGSSQLLAQLRKAGNNKLCDIELVVEGRKEYVHSAIVAVHSKLFYRLINTEQSPPFSYDLHHFSYDSVRSIIDWMYFGEAKFSSDICSHLAVAAYFEVPEVHSLLEQQLIRLAMNPSTIPVALLTCAEEKAKVSNSTSALIINYLLSSTFPNPPLTTKTAKYLLSRDEGNLKRKAQVISLVLKWLALHRDQADTVLEHIQNVEMSEDDERALISRLAVVVKNKEDVRVEVDNKNRLTVVSGIGAGPRSEKDLVSCGSLASPAQSEMDVYQHIAYSPLRSMKKELDKLPDVFKQTNTPVKNKEKRASVYPPYIERPPGYLPPSFRGHIDMHIQLSTTSTPSFAALTSAAAAAPSAVVRQTSSKTNTSSYLEPVGAAFTAESIADIARLPEMFDRKPSNYGIQQQQQNYVPPSRNVSSVYAQSAPYGPSYTEGQTVQQPYLQHHQQALPQSDQSLPLPVKLELPGGAVVIPHAAHPMLPYSQPYVEVRLPNQPMYPSNFTEYSQSRFKTSEYAGMY